jgi:hypothetical protein
VEFTGIFEANTEFSGIFILRIYWLNFSLIEGENCLGGTDKKLEEFFIP